MLLIHPNVRLVSAIGFMAAIIAAKSLISLNAVYILIFVSILATSCFRKHLSFVLLVTIPILLALIIVWEIILPKERIPVGYTSGMNYAFFNWLRIVAFGGTLQALLLPLVQHPTYLKVFLERNGLSKKGGALILASITFIPEVQRRMGRIIDARRAQGYVVSGFSALRQLPEVLMPLVASLLDSATKRAELWGHRGIFLEQSTEKSNYKWTSTQTIAAIVVSITAITLSVLL